MLMWVNVLLGGLYEEMRRLEGEKINKEEENESFGKLPGEDK